MSLADHFVRLGFGAADAASRAALVDSVSQGFHALTGGPPTWRWFVPGRLEVLGKHTDYAGGHVLAGTVPRGFAMVAGPRADRRVRVIDVANRVHLDLGIDDDGPARTGWASYIQVTMRRLAANFPGAPLGLDLAFSSDLPRAAGVSSSSAIVVGIATALVRRGNLVARDEWQAAITSAEDQASYFGCLESGHDFRTLAGNAGVGTHGGSEDHSAILMSRAGHLGHYRFVPTTRLAVMPCPPEWTFVVGVSGVHADKAGTVRDRYNRAAFTAAALLAVWNGAAAVPAPSLSVALEAPGAEAELRRLVATAAPQGIPAADLLRRLDHFLAEDAIVNEAARACARGDAAALGALAEASQARAEAWLGNQVPETVTLAALARGCGARGATSFGAGFGGSVWALVDDGDAAAFARAWIAAYSARHPGMPNVAWFAARPGPGLVDVPADDE
jgi:galactokinase